MSWVRSPLAAPRSPLKAKSRSYSDFRMRGQFSVTQADVLVQAHEAPPAWLTEFEPHPWLTSGHLQTIVGNFLPRPAFNLPAEAETVEVDAADGSRVLCHCHWQPEPVRAARLTLVLLHGLNGSSNSRYIRGVTARAWDAGMNVVRMNMRNCGGSEAL